VLGIMVATFLKAASFLRKRSYLHIALVLLVVKLLASGPLLGGYILTSFLRAIPTNDGGGENVSMERMENKTQHSIPQLSDVQLLISAYPGSSGGKDRRGFTEMSQKFVRSLQFFWPRDQLDLAVVLDDNTYETTEQQKELSSQVTSMFKDDIMRLSVAWNPRCNQSLYGKGYYIQQLIMFWADNFTDAEYIGFVDDDTVFTKAVQPFDLFDMHGRPHVKAKYWSGEEAHILHKWFMLSTVALGEPSFVQTMFYFPVVIKREHLAEIRGAILQTHPDCACFDQAFSKLISMISMETLPRKRNMDLSQFIVMFDHLWRNHREDYSWHFHQPESPEYPNGIPVDSPASKKYFYIKSGTLSENRITPGMLRPFPRIADHVRCRALFHCVPQDYIQKITNILRRGYCFSQPLVEDGNNGVYRYETTADPRCSNYDTWNDINFDGEWKFENWLQPEVMPEGTLLAHQERMKRNQPREWDTNELEKIFQ